MFGELISQGLTQSPTSKKTYCEYRIQSLIYDSQMETSEPTSNLMSQSLVANQPNTNVYGSPVFERSHRENTNFVFYTNLFNG